MTLLSRLNADAARRWARQFHTVVARCVRDCELGHTRVELRAVPGMRHHRLRQISGVTQSSDQPGIATFSARRRRIPTRYKLVFGCLIVTLAIWLISLRDINHYFRSMGVQIVLNHGQLFCGSGMGPYVVFRYDMSRPFWTSVVLAVWQ